MYVFYLYRQSRILSKKVLAVPCEHYILFFFLKKVNGCLYILSLCSSIARTETYSNNTDCVYVLGCAPKTQRLYSDNCLFYF